MPGVSGVTVVTMLVYFFTCTRGCGRIKRPAFPARSDFRGQDVPNKTRAKTRGEIANSYLDVIARSNANRAIQNCGNCTMDCFAEPVIGRAFRAARWLAKMGWTAPDGSNVPDWWCD